MSAPVRLAALGLAAATACASPGIERQSMFGPAMPAAGSALPMNRLPCSSCRDVIPLPPELTRAIESRLTDLERRGGVCSQYAAVLEGSYRSGRITLRPYMWRVGGRLVSGEARPNGEMVLAREIDSLNVGVRTVDDVLWSVEHEAVHIALRLAPDAGLDEDRANRYVRACRTDDAIR